MAAYVTDEASFEIPDGFVDRSITMLSTTRGGSPMSVVLNRDPVREPLEKQVATTLEAVKKAAPATKVVGVRAREVGGLPGREARLNVIAQKQALYVRQAYVTYYERLLTITITGQRGHQATLDSVAEKLLSTMQFRRK